MHTAAECAEASRRSAPTAEESALVRPMGTGGVEHRSNGRRGPTRVLSSGRLSRVVVALAASTAAATCSSVQPSDTGDAGTPSVVAPTVVVSDLIGPVAPCGAGFAHPNVCCRDGACLTGGGDPFAACSADALTFPDRHRCCPLDGGSCVDAPTGAGGGDAAVVGGCSLPCGPEGKPSTDSGIPPCGNGATSNGTCAYCCMGPNCPTNLCTCAQVTPGGSACCRLPQCHACPSAWGAAGVQADLCCASPSRCFSQSTEVLAPEGGGSLGGPGGCESVEYGNGHLHAITCDANTASCLCSIDGTTIEQIENSIVNGNGNCDVQTCAFPPL